MKELDELLIHGWLIPADVSTRVLYHYTTAAGLIGILSSGYLRGTNAAFLNDSSEIEYGLAICIEVIEAERSMRASEAERKLLQRVLEMMREETLPDKVYVTSFAARRNVLSQWRGYGSPDGRFCIGFQLSQFSERDVLQLPRPVEYSPEAQKTQVRRAIEIACRSAVEAGEDPRLSWGSATSLMFHLRRIMCTFKHPGFDEEEEWRAVTTISPLDDLRPVQFEAVRGMPRPYVVMLAGSRRSHMLPVVEICIGPAERKKAVYRATKMLRDRFGYEGAEVTETSIPFAG